MTAALNTGRMLVVRRTSPPTSSSGMCRRSVRRQTSTAVVARSLPAHQISGSTAAERIGTPRDRRGVAQVDHPRTFHELLFQHVETTAADVGQVDRDDLLLREPEILAPHESELIPDDEPFPQ